MARPTDAFQDAHRPADPWAAGAFQVQRNGTRYYTDILPADNVWPEWDEPVPGFTSLKPSKPYRKTVAVGDAKYTVPLDWHRAGEWVGDLNPVDAGDLCTGHDRMRHAFYKGANSQRDRDFARGHAIHACAEAALTGTPTPAWAETNTDAAPYLPWLRQWIDDNVAAALAIEAVVFSRIHRYAGTGDAWLKLKGPAAELADVAYVDWKSRGPGSPHNIYEEEIAQGGAYTAADYAIAPTADRAAAQRDPLPAATHGLVVSIRPDGIEHFGYDLAVARDAFVHMLGAYRSVSEFGKTARKAKIKIAPGSGRPSAPATPVYDRPPPDEGGPADPAAVTALHAHYMAIPDRVRKGWLAQLASEAGHGHNGRGRAPYNLGGPTGAHTIRRFEITRALIHLCDTYDPVVTEAVRLTTRSNARDYDDEARTELLSHLLYTVTDGAKYGGGTAGAALGSLNAEEATAFANLVDAWVADPRCDDHGNPTAAHLTANQRTQNP